MSGWANHIEPIKGTRQRLCRMWRRPCQSQARHPGSGVWHGDGAGRRGDGGMTVSAEASMQARRASGRWGIQRRLGLHPDRGLPLLDSADDFGGIPAGYLGGDVTMRAEVHALRNVLLRFFLHDDEAQAARGRRGAAGRRGGRRGSWRGNNVRTPEAPLTADPCLDTWIAMTNLTG